MPRKKKKLARRVDPRGVVSREALEVEAGYLAREREDYLLLATNELRQMLAHRRTLWAASNAALEPAVQDLPERDRLAVQCLLVRDLYHVLELYCTHLGRPSGINSPSSRVPTPRPPATEVAGVSLPFSDWLFPPGQ